MIVGDGERHELLQRHAVLGVKIEKFCGNCREAQPLLHHSRTDEEARRDFFLANAFVPQSLKARN